MAWLSVYPSCFSCYEWIWYCKSEYCSENTKYVVCKYVRYFCNLADTFIKNEFLEDRHFVNMYSVDLFYVCTYFTVIHWMRAMYCTTQINYTTHSVCTWRYNSNTHSLPCSLEKHSQTYFSKNSCLLMRRWSHTLFTLTLRSTIYHVKLTLSNTHTHTLHCKYTCLQNCLLIHTCHWVYTVQTASVYSVTLTLSHTHTFSVDMVATGFLCYPLARLTGVSVCVYVCVRQSGDPLLGIY